MTRLSVKDKLEEKVKVINSTYVMCPDPDRTSLNEYCSHLSLIIIASESHLIFLVAVVADWVTMRLPNLMWPPNIR